MSYRLGQSFPRPFAGYAYPRKRHQFIYFPKTSTVYNATVTQTATASQTITSQQIKFRTISDTATASQTISFHAPISHQTVTQSATANQTLSVFKVRALIVSQSATSSQSSNSNRIYSETVSQDIVASQNATFRLATFHLTVTNSATAFEQVHPQDDIVFFTVTSSATASQRVNIQRSFIVESDANAFQAIARLNNTYNLTITQGFLASDSIVGRNGTRHLVINQNATANQNFHILNQVYLLSVSQSATASQKVNTTYSFTITSSATAAQISNKVNQVYNLIVSQEATSSQVVSGHNATYHFTVISTATAGQQANNAGGIILRTVTNSATASQIIRLTYTIIQDVTATQQIHVRKVLKTQHITNIIHPTSTFTKQRTANRTLLDLLEPSNILTRTVVFSPRLIDQRLIVSSIFKAVVLQGLPAKDPRGFGGVTTPHPIGSGAVVARANLVLLESELSAIALPAPEFGDSVRNHDTVVITRSISGLLYANIKSSKTNILNYTWILDLRKAQELRIWLSLNMSRLITVTNWKGEVWTTEIISENIQFNNEARFGSKARQKVTASIQFEGVKQYG